MSIETVTRAAATSIIVAVLLFGAHDAVAKTFRADRVAGTYIDFAHQHTSFASRPFILIADYTDPHTSERTLAHSYVRFDLDAIERRSSSDVVRARLYFRILSHMGTDHGRLRIAPAAHPWSDGTDVTWAHQPASVVGHDVISAPLTFDSGWHFVDITPLIKEWLDGHVNLSNGLSLGRRDAGWLIAIDDNTTPAYITVEYSNTLPLGRFLGDIMDIVPGVGSVEDATGDDDADESSDASDDGVAPEEDSALTEEEESDSSSDDTDDESSTASDNVDSADETASTVQLVPLSPMDGEHINSVTPTFRWQAAGTEHLDKVVLAMKNMTGVVFFDTEVDKEADRYTLSRALLTPGRWYRWYLVGYRDGEQVLQTEEHAFIIEESGSSTENEQNVTHSNGGSDASASNDVSTRSSSEDSAVHTAPTSAVTDTQQNTSQGAQSSSVQNSRLLVVYRLVVVALLALIAALLWYITTVRHRTSQGKKAKRSRSHKERKVSDEDDADK